MALFSCCNCDPTTDEETQVDVDSSSRGGGGTSDGACFGMDGTLLVTPEQKQREKERLQALVKAFAKAAVAGASCFFVDVPSQQRIAAHYMLDKGLKTFTVVFPNGVEHSFPLSFDVYSYDDLLHFPSTLMLAREPGIASLTDDEKRRLVMLEYMDSSERHLSRLFLMETEDDRRDRFLTCMRILKLYSLAPLASSANENSSITSSAGSSSSSSATAGAVDHPVGNGT